MEEILQKVKKQYEKFPYPDFSLLAAVKKSSLHHACFETGSKLFHEKPQHHQDKSIALIGCGTTETLAFASTHKNAQISAVDLSRKAIAAAKLSCKIRGHRRVKFFNEDVLTFQNREERFDYIHCYGVLHHLSQPQKGFEAISRLVKPNGFARIMVYSAAARQRVNIMRSLLKKMGYAFDNHGFEKNVKKFAQTLPWDNPLRLTFEMHPEVKTTAGLVDAFLHSQEHSFTLHELKENLQNAGLHIGAWDFTQNILNLLKDAAGDSIEEKIETLEAFDQWPTHFTFWVSHKPQQQKINLRP